MEEKQKSRPWLTWLAVGVVVVVAYPLSEGPMIALGLNGYLPRWLDNLPIYLPLHLLGEQIPPIAEWTSWYCGFWIEPFLSPEPGLTRRRIP
ncbi:MAG: hypothetical protein JWN70_6844 [Planctomycetaceae bacterium]|nr:hypothetical protein [Planctomycetaceae bacterium]